MALGEHRVKKAQQIGYPRSFLNRFVKKVCFRPPDSPNLFLNRLINDLKVHDACVLQLATPLDSCLLYPAPTYATACKKYLCSPLNRIIHPEADKVIIRVVDFDSKEITTSVHEGASTIRLYAVFFPSEYNQLAMSFWRLTGTGISSRLAENLVEGLDRLREVTGLSPLALKQGVNSAGVVAVDRLCKRIVDLLERAPVGPPRPVQVSKSDVFLYQTGMSAIYHCHQLLLKWRGTESVVFGFPYELTLKLLQTYGKGCVFYGFGTPEELDQLEEHLQSELENGRAVQAVWCECPSNPLLRTVNLDRIRQLADRFGFVVVVDDTIGSFANVDVLHVADIIITSLTKSFSGHADVMGGRYLALHPSCARSLLTFKFSQYRSESLLTVLFFLEILLDSHLPQRPLRSRCHSPRKQLSTLSPPCLAHEHLRRFPGLSSTPTRLQPPEHRHCPLLPIHLLVCRQLPRSHAAPHGRFYPRLRWAFHH